MQKIIARDTNGTPYSYSRADAAHAERKAAALREKAERIARAELDRRGYVPGNELTFIGAWHIATAAALAALTDKEDAR